MFTNRMINLFVAIALIVVVGITVHEVAATRAVISSTRSMNAACDTLPSYLSLHSEYTDRAKSVMTYTEDGPTGVDGGLIYLLSTERTCGK